MQHTQVATKRQSPSGPLGRDSSAPRQRTVIPPVDIVEDNSGITVYADLPGVSRDTLDVKIHDGHLSIEGEVTIDVPPTIRVQHMEVQQPRFARTFLVSLDLDTSKITASLENGVLRLSIPRREEAKPRRITVTSG
ncbi:Hsp20/alpha crystallin family protein [Cupriavidus agavae]|uniref:Hsp20/alpha crystallin family protein n=1 Tax=Cupriavidus agavae TaxID=1001822 RepID=UPI0038B2A003